MLFSSIVGIGFCWLAGWQPSKSVLKIGSYGTNIGYPIGGSIGGIEWKESYADLRVTMENSEATPILNLDLTVQIVDGGIIWDIGQMSDIPGIEFRPPEMPDANVRLKLGDGGTATLSVRDMLKIAGEKQVILTNHWRVFCPRLMGKAQLRLILATPSEKAIGVTHPKIHVFGTYELMPSEGSKIIKVDTTVPVK